jgi:hypothetical protein
MSVPITTCLWCHKNYGTGDKCQHCGWNNKKPLTVYQEWEPLFKTTIKGSVMVKSPVDLVPIDIELPHETHKRKKHEHERNTR